MGAAAFASLRGVASKAAATVAINATATATATAAASAAATATATVDPDKWKNGYYVPSTEERLAEMAGRDSYMDQPRHSVNMLWFCAALLLLATLRHIAITVERRVPWVRARLTQPGSAAVRWRALSRAVTIRRYKGVSVLAWGSIIAMSLFATIYCFAIQPYYRPNYMYGSPPLALRSGVMAIALLPVSMIVGLKITPVPWLTGLSYAELNVYHRWFSRVMLFLSVVHTVPFVIQYGQQSFLSTWYHVSAHYIVWTGIASLALLIWIVFSSFLPLRNRAYEFFVVQHILTSVLFVFFMYLHCGLLMDSRKYVSATICIWAGSVAARTFMHTIPRLIRGERKFRRAAYPSLVEALPGLVRITVPVGRDVLWHPGQHVFLRWGGLKNAHQNHPYSVVNAKLDPSDAMVLLVKVEQGISRSLHDEVQRHCVSYGPDDSLLTAHESEFPSITKLMIVDGPYGAAFPYRMYDQLVLLAGGSGAASIIAPFQAWCAHQAANLAIGRLQDVPPRVTMLWAIRDPNHRVWYEPLLRDAYDQCVSLGIEVDVHIYVTRQTSPEVAEKGLASAPIASAPIASAELKDEATARHPWMAEHGIGLATVPQPSFMVRTGRPNLSAILPNLWERSRGRVACLACGSAPFMGDVERGVTRQQQTIARGTSAITDLAYIAEAYTW